MAQATKEEFETAIANFRFAAARHRRTAQQLPRTHWAHKADLRVAAKADQQAQELTRRMNALFA